MLFVLIKLMCKNCIDCLLMGARRDFTISANAGAGHVAW